MGKSNSGIWPIPLALAKSKSVQIQPGFRNLLTLLSDPDRQVRNNLGSKSRQRRCRQRSRLHHDRGESLPSSNVYRPSTHSFRIPMVLLARTGEARYINRVSIRPRVERALGPLAEATFGTGQVHEVRRLVRPFRTYMVLPSCLHLYSTPPLYPLSHLKSSSMHRKVTLLLPSHID